MHHKRYNTHKRRPAQITTDKFQYKFPVYNLRIDYFFCRSVFFLSFILYTRKLYVSFFCIFHHWISLGLCALFVPSMMNRLSMTDTNHCAWFLFLLTINCLDQNYLYCPPYSKSDTQSTVLDITGSHHIQNNRTA